MSNKRIIAFVAVAVTALAVFAFAGLPYANLDFASAQYGSSSYGGAKAGFGIPSGQTGLTFGDAVNGVVVNTNPALRASRAVIYDAPNGNVIATDGGEAPVTGFDATGNWCRVWLGGEASGWVPCPGFNPNAVAPTATP